MDLRAHAKINLHLHSVQRRKDGYHELDTVFCHLDLHDDVHVALRQGVIEFASQTGLSVTEDLAGRASRLACKPSSATQPSAARCASSNASRQEAGSAAARQMLRRSYVGSLSCGPRRLLRSPPSLHNLAPTSPSCSRVDWREQAVSAMS